MVQVTTKTAWPPFGVPTKWDCSMLLDMHVTAGDETGVADPDAGRTA